MKNPAAFYNVVRTKYGPLRTAQVEGFELLIEVAEARDVKLWDFAYILATVWHETARTMQPVTEYGSSTYLRSKKYWPYIGRGYVQLTWEYNYEKATRYFRDVIGIDVDFVKNPELANDPDYAAIILFVGMAEGWFTGKKLSDYIDNIDEEDKEDLREFANARRIVNGTDRQVEIGEHALVFEAALKAGGYTGKTPIETIPSKSEVKETPKKPLWIRIAEVIVKGAFGLR